MSEVSQLIAAALAGRRAWLVGGAVRDELLGRPHADFDVIVAGEAAAAARAARALADHAKRRGTPAACFSLSEQFGAWRVAARDGSWQIDVQPLQGGSLQADLALRDFTVNAIARPLGGDADEPVDPFGGLADLRAGRLRMVAPRAFVDDPLRVLRLARIAVELGFEPEPDTLACVREYAADLAGVAGERVFAELQRLLAGEQAGRGLELIERLAASEIVLPELHALRGVGQNRYHHLDVYGHTLEVLDRTIAIQADPSSIFGAEREAELRLLLDEPLADGLTRGQALRWGALLHDAAKPLTRAAHAGDRRVTFLGHDVRGAELASEVLGRLRTSVRLREHVAALVRHHLRLGFLVHRPQPLDRETVYDYLAATGSVAVDVTLLSVADRQATRGADSDAAIAAHLGLAREMLGYALRWRAEGPPRALLRGDELVAELGLPPGPRLGQALQALVRAQFAGRVATREQALDFVRRLQEPLARQPER